MTRTATPWRFLQGLAGAPGCLRAPFEVDGCEGVAEARGSRARGAEESESEVNPLGGTSDATLGAEELPGDCDAVRAAAGQHICPPCIRKHNYHTWFPRCDPFWLLLLAAMQ